MSYDHFEDFQEAREDARALANAFRDLYKLAGNIPEVSDAFKSVEHLVKDYEDSI